MQIISVLAPNCLKILHSQISQNSIISLTKSVIIWACKLLNIQDVVFLLFTPHLIQLPLFISMSQEETKPRMSTLVLDEPVTLHDQVSAVSFLLLHKVIMNNPCLWTTAATFFRHKAKTEKTSNACTKFVLSEPSVKECSWRENWCWLVVEATENSFMRFGVHSRGAEDSRFLGFHNVWPAKFTHPPWKQWNLFTSQHCVTFYKTWIFRYSFVIYNVVAMPSIYKYIKCQMYYRTK